MNTSLYFKRVIKALRPEWLRQLFVAIIGCGSGGSRTATELGRLGITLVLVDRPGELLEEHNIHRHELGYASLGKPKTTELASHIRSYNPSAQIETLDCDIVADSATFEKHVTSPKVDLIVVATDNQESKHVINDIAFCHGVPVIGAGVYDGGVGGEVYRTGPGMACYACIADHLQLKAEPTRKKLNVDYNNLDLGEIRSTSALNLDIAQIALIQSRIVLNALLGEKDMPIGLPSQVNFLTFANRLVPGPFERPLHADFYVIDRRPDCLICGQQPDTLDQQAEAILKSIRCR